MKTDEIERLAKDKKPLPEYTDLPECEYYWAMRYLYELYRMGRIDRNEGHIEKRKALRRYERAAAVFQDYIQTCKEWQENIQRSELLRAKINKAETLREKYDHATAAIIAMTGDRTLKRG